MLPSTSPSLPLQDAATLESLHPWLRDLLARELCVGNEIREISTGWPKSTSILVALKHVFKADNPSPPSGIAYNELNDPHYWFAEFVHNESGQMVVCPFRR